MKKIVLGISILLSCLLLVNCGEKQEKSASTSEQKATTDTEATEEKINTNEDASEPKLIGKWVITKAEGPNAELNKGTEYTFTATEMSTSSAKGKYTISGDTILNVFEGMETPFKYMYKFEGDNLVLELTNSGGQKFTLSKQ